MDTLNEVVSEDRERAKTYLENALKILGICQIAGGIADMFWNGYLNFTMFNSVIVVTGFIFFLGSSALKEPLRKLLYMESKEEVENKFKATREVHYSKEELVEDYKEKQLREYHEKFGNLIDK